MVASVARGAGRDGSAKAAGSVAIEGAEAFNSPAFPAGKFRAAGGLIKPTPAEIPENRQNMDWEVPSSGLQFDRSHLKGIGQ